MGKAATCRDVFNGHCNHWGLSEAAHALIHVQMRRMNEVYEADMAAGHGFGRGSESSAADDGPRFEELLRDEGYIVVPIAGRPD
jgi:hypothetical protein